jgi:hypothetical protein
LKLQSQLPVPEHVYEWLRNEKLKHLDDKHYKFIVRLIAAYKYCLQHVDKGFPFLPRKYYKGINLRSIGHVSIYDKAESDSSEKHNTAFVGIFRSGNGDPLVHFYHYEAKILPRKFVLETWFGQKYMPLLLKELINVDKPIFVNLYDGKPIIKNKYFSKECKYPPANLLSIRRSLKSIQPRIFNRDAIVEHLSTHEKRGDSDSRHMSDVYCWINILLMGVTPVEPEKGVYSYKARYKILSSGRVAELGGGFQTCTRLMKYASIQGVEDIYNYDLKGSQVNGLIHQFKLQDLDASWLEQYVNNPNAKAEYANRVGLSVDCWKECLLLVVMGGSINAMKPKVGSSNMLVHTDFFNVIQKELSKDNIEADDHEVNRVREIVISELSDLLKPLSKWRASLKKDYYKLGSQFGRKYKGRILIKNYLGIPYFVDEFTQAKLAARILQGQEAAFIHKITEKSSQSTFNVVANEHDGVITIGKIPVEVIDSVKEELGINEYSGPRN